MTMVAECCGTAEMGVGRGRSGRIGGYLALDALVMSNECLTLTCRLVFCKKHLSTTVEVSRWFRSLWPAATLILKRREGSLFSRSTTPRLTTRRILTEDGPDNRVTALGSTVRMHRTNEPLHLGR